MPGKTRKDKKRATSAKAWKANSARLEMDLDVPSGNTCYVRRLGLDTFLKRGMIPDSLTPIVEEAVRKGKGLPPNIQRDMLKDEKLVNEMFEMMDTVVCEAVLEPPVHFSRWCKHCHENFQTLAEKDAQHNDADHGYESVEIPTDDRDEDALYSDDVDFEDRSFIFQFVAGGSRDLQRFRKGTAEAVGGLSSGEDVPSEAE